MIIITSELQTNKIAHFTSDKLMKNLRAKSTRVSEGELEGLSRVRVCLANQTVGKALSTGLEYSK